VGRGHEVREAGVRNLIRAATTARARSTQEDGVSEEKTYTGGCHCGAVRYRVSLKLEGAMTCNCSICSKTGTMLAFVPAAKFELTGGEDALTDYQFGKKRIHHLFCKTCGIRSFARGAMPNGDPIAAVNVRCLDEIDPAAIPTKSFDGRSLPIDG
jgi:hypothetical protein